MNGYRRTMRVSRAIPSGSLALGLLLIVLFLVIIPGTRESEALLPGHDCAGCHTVHGASGFGQLLNADIVETLCLTCHGPGGASTLKADVHVNEARSEYPAFYVTCRDCHDPHDGLANWLGSVNIMAVGSAKDFTRLAKIPTINNGIQNVVFTSRGTSVGELSLHSFADADEDLNGVYDGVCEMCHTLTKHHRNNPSGGHVHNAGKTCTECHSHATNFNRR